jgi:GT2 family glycosyltransferase
MTAIRPGARRAEPNTGAPEWFRPIRLLDIEIGRPLDAVDAGIDQQGRAYERALALVRLHGRPVATVPFDLPPRGLDAATLRSLLRESLEGAPRAHLLDHDPDTQPGEIGRETSSLGEPLAMAERSAFLARAPFASVVIATRNRPDNLARCLDSLATLVYPDFEVIVVDNAPSDDATERFFAARYASSARIRYVREDRPGLASAHNRGVREMSPCSRFVAFTDDDVVVDPFWLGELMRGFEAAPNVGCVTGLIFPAELETWPQLLIEQFGGFNKGFRRQIYDQSRHRPADRLFPFTPGRFGSGANMAFRTEALARIGGFDPAIGTGTPALGGDDLAAFFQVIRAGYALVYEPAAIVRHTHYRDYAALQRQIYGYGVGLTAFLTKALLDEPRLLPVLARKLPGGLLYALSARSGKNQKKGRDYPPELTALERKGMVYGPVAYLRSRIAARRLDRAVRR